MKPLLLAISLLMMAYGLTNVNAVPYMNSPILNMTGQPDSVILGYQGLFYGLFVVGLILFSYSTFLAGSSVK